MTQDPEHSRTARAPAPEPPPYVAVDEDPVEAAMIRQLAARAGRHPGQIIEEDEA